MSKRSKKPQVGDYCLLSDADYNPPLKLKIGKIEKLKVMNQAKAAKLLSGGKITEWARLSDLKWDEKRSVWVSSLTQKYEEKHGKNHFLAFLRQKPVVDSSGTISSQGGFNRSEVDKLLSVWNQRAPVAIAFYVTAFMIDSAVPFRDFRLVHAILILVLSVIGSILLAEGYGARKEALRMTNFVF